MKKKTILIVDDTFENLYLLRAILEEAGYDVIQANDGRDGFEKLQKNNNVDLIISDILMPVLDGYMFCQACKKEKLFKDIPFVFYTSTYTEKPDEDLAFQLGAVGFLRKPTDQEKILQVIEDIFANVTTKAAPVKKVKFTDEEVLTLYSNRLISKLEQKNLDLEKEISEREKVQQTLVNENEVLDLIAKNASLKKIFDHILLNYQSLHPEYYGSISLLDKDGIHLDHVSAPSIPAPYNIAIKRVVIGESVGSCGTAAFTKKSVIVSDICTDKLWVDYKEIALKHNLKSCWSIPILSEEKTVFGTFAIYSNTINEPSVEDIEELNSCVRLASMAIVKANIIAEVKQSEESYRSLVEQASDAIITFSFEGSIYDFNKVASNSLGYTKKEFSKLRMQDIVVGDLIKYSKNKQLLQQGKPIITYRKLLHKEGAIIDAEISIKMQIDGKLLGIARDVTERKKIEEAIVKSEKYLDSIINNIGDPIFVKDDHNNMLLANNAFCELFNLSREDIIDKEFVASVPAEELEVFSRNNIQVLSDGKENISEEFLTIGDNKTLTISTKKTRFIDDNGKKHLIGVIHDISERKLAENELKLAKVKAEESDHLKTEFLNNMSHEIRTPMNGILGFSDFLCDANLSAEKRNSYVKIIQNSGHQLLRIIDDILEISRLETKQVKLKEEKTHLNNFLFDLFAIFDIKAKENQVSLYRHKGLSNERSIILTDSIKLHKVLSNLLENALKFTREGQIKFGYELKNNRLEFYVRDTGVGIPMDKTEVIFERFSQADKELSKKVGGLGLGLSIAKENVILLGGDLSVTSKISEGSTFKFHIPYKPFDSSIETPEKGNNEDVENRNTILIVEDEEVNFMFIEILLLEQLKLDCHIIHAVNGKEAVEICKTDKHIDLVLMDLKMPVMNGFEATKLIKELRPDLPIIAQSAYTSTEDRKKAEDAGCNDFISKPIKKEKLKNSINNFIPTRP